MISSLQKENNVRLLLSICKMFAVHDQTIWQRTNYLSVIPSREKRFLRGRPTSIQRVSLQLAGLRCSLVVKNKLCAWRHNMPRPLYAGRCGPAAAHPLRLQRPARLASNSCGAMAINELMNINDVRESATIFPRPCKLTF